MNPEPPAPVELEEVPEEQRKTSPIVIGAAVVALFAVAVTFGNSGERRLGRTEPPKDMRILSFGYLSAATLPESMNIVSPPPLQGSDAMRRDEEARAEAIANPGAARLRQAEIDSVLAFPQAAKNFSCAFGMDIDKDKTPALYNLMGKILIDVRASAYRAKSHYKRPRPFVVHNTPSCAPDYAQRVRGDGSYPSGQSATGWAYAMVLSDLNPAHRDALYKRAHDFGQSRLICDVQWKSDVDAGRPIAGAVMERARATPDFKSDFAAARAEVDKAIKSGSIPPVNCAAEAVALGRPVPSNAG